MTERVELVCDDARCLILPQCGGSLGGWWVAGEPLLRAASPAAMLRGDPTALSGFPLVPYSNRIAQARFDFGGEAVQLRRNRSDEDHALHGLGWQRPWSVVARTENSATLRLAHPGDADWPWPFVAEQTVTLAPMGLSLAFRVRNDAGESAPLCIGHHPYFERGGACLTLSADRVWINDQAGLPLAAGPPLDDLLLADGPAISDREIDNCYEGVHWPVRIAWPTRGLSVIMTASADLANAVVYSNAAADALCVEPVAHVSNALNLPDETAFPVCSAGEQVTSRIDMVLQTD